MEETGEPDPGAPDPVVDAILGIADEDSYRSFSRNHNIKAFTCFSLVAQCSLPPQLIQFSNFNDLVAFSQLCSIHM